MTTRSAVVLTLAAVCFGSLALAQPAESPDPPLVNWSAPPFWTPPSAGEPRRGVAREEILNSHGVSTQSLPSSPLPFVAVSPCRLYDSRANSPFTGDSTFTTDGQTEQFNFYATSTTPYAANGNPNGCTLPTAGTVGAWSLKFTYRTSSATQGYLTAYPGTLSSVPGIGTILGSSDRFTSGAAIVPAGTDADSTIKVYAQYAANTVVIDYNGYFAAASALYLPYAGVGSSATDLFSIQNTGTGSAIHGITTGGTAVVADANGFGGVGIQATALDTGIAGTFNGYRGIVAYGGYYGGYFADYQSPFTTGSATLGAPHHGVEAYGTSYGGYFANGTSSPTGSATLGAPGTGGSFTGLSFGIQANGGSGTAGYFTGYNGVQGYGSNYAGYFADKTSAPTGSAKLGLGGIGIQAHGQDRGGDFGGNNWGVKADGSSSGVGGYFTGHWGIQAYGSEFGVYATAPTSAGSSGIAGYFSGWEGVLAWGTAYGGSFVGTGTGTGIYATASSGLAGYFTGANGIQAWGTTAGGYGVYGYNSNTGTYSYLGKGTYKVYGSGSVSFVQNHPYDPTRVIVYSAPESDEVGTYTRGTARLVNGEARVPLGETFAWVTNPDIGLTVYLTPIGDWSDLYVAEKSTSSIVVRSVHGPPDATFDYIVWGLRIGFEEVGIVQEKEKDAYIPAMTTHEQLFQKHPDLRRFTSLARYETERAQVLGAKALGLDLSASEKLKAAIGVFVPDVTSLEGAKPAAAAQTAARHADVTPPGSGTLENASAPPFSATPINGSGAQVLRPVSDPSSDAYSRSFHSLQRELAYTVRVDEAVEPGDVLVAASDRPGVMRRAATDADAAVVGVVAAAPGVVLGEALDQATGDPLSTANGYADLAVSGIVRCKVDASYGPIRVGDLLITSPTPGHARAAKAPAPGTVVGKALEPLDAGTGAIRVLVMVR